MTCNKTVIYNDRPIPDFVSSVADDAEFDAGVLGVWGAAGGVCEGLVGAGLDAAAADDEEEEAERATFFSHLGHVFSTTSLNSWEGSTNSLSRFGNGVISDSFCENTKYENHT